MITDRAIGWRTKKIFIPVQDMAGFGADGISVGAGAPALTVSSLAAAELFTAPMAANDEIYFFWFLPWDLDKDQIIKAKVHYFSATTDADAAIDWEIWLKGLTELEAFSDAKVSADFTSAFAADTVSATDNSYEITSALDITASTFAADDTLCIGAIELDSTDGTADECELIGLELEYTLDACDPTGRKTTA